MELSAAGTSPDTSSAKLCEPLCDTTIPTELRRAHCEPTFQHNTLLVLDIDMDQFTGPVTLVADRCAIRRPDHFTGKRVAVAQIEHHASAQNPRDRAGWDAQLGTDPVLATALLDP